MKKIILISLIIVLVVLFGTFPLTILSKIFDYISIALQWLASAINVFGWNGILR